MKCKYTNKICIFTNKQIFHLIFPPFKGNVFHVTKKFFLCFLKTYWPSPGGWILKDFFTLSFITVLQPRKKMNNSSLMRGGEEYYSETFPIYNFQWVTEGLLLLIVSTIGIVGNACSVVTCTKQRIQRVFHRLLLALATFDTVSSYIISLYLFYN